MNSPALSVREMTLEDIPMLLKYWLEASDDYMEGMGVDLSKRKGKEDLELFFTTSVLKPYSEKSGYYVIWELDGEAVGYSNVNMINYGEEALMHLHVINSDKRRKGLGTEFIKLTLPLFFENLKLERINCQPYAYNLAPNKALNKAGFEFVKQYLTVPGPINFEQEVMLWRFKKESVGQL